MSKIKESEKFPLLAKWNIPHRLDTDKELTSLLERFYSLEEQLSLRSKKKSIITGRLGKLGLLRLDDLKSAASLLQKQPLQYSVELLNMRRAWAKCQKQKVGSHFDLQTQMRSFHRALFRGLVQQRLSGEWRDRNHLIRKARTQSKDPRGPWSKNKEWLEFPDFKDVPALVRELDRWIKTHSNLDANLVGAAIHQVLVGIHPFQDGNGRVARLIHQTYLRSRKSKSSILTDTESVFRGHFRQKYLLLFRLQLKKTDSLTAFTKFSLKCFIKEYQELKSEIG